MTVGELQDRIDVDEFTHWVVYMKQHPKEKL